MVNELKDKLANDIQQIENGYKDAYTLYIELKDLSKFIGDCLSQIEEQVIDEVGNEKLQYGGYEIETRKGSKRYLFNHIDNIKQLKDKMKHLENLHKIAYDRQIKNLEPLVNAETGELVEPAVVKYSKDSVVVKKAKKI